jgi:cytochrome P450
VAQGYEVAKPAGAAGSLLSMIEPTGHAERRKIWDRAFTPNAIKSYEPLLAARVSELLENLSARLGTEVDLAEWVRYGYSPARRTYRADALQPARARLHG